MEFGGRQFRGTGGLQMVVEFRLGLRHEFPKLRRIARFQQLHSFLDDFLVDFAKIFMNVAVLIIGWFRIGLRKIRQNADGVFLPFQVRDEKVQWLGDV